MLDLFHQAKPLRAKLILALVLILVACAPTSPTPNQITSTDTIGEIITRYPSGWTDYVEDDATDGRQGVTLVRAERSAIADLATLPVVRLSYDRRSDTPLKENQPLAEYALRLVTEQMPNVTFSQPQLRQVSSYASVSLQGVDASTNLNYLYTLVDYISEDGVLFAVLTAPGSLASYTGDYDLILENTSLTIRSVPPTITPLPESTVDPASGATDASLQTTAVPDVTLIAPESSAEVQPTLFAPESTVELSPVSQNNDGSDVEPTSVPDREAVFLSTATAPGIVTLSRGVQFQKPEGWVASSNSQTNATLFDGQHTADALLSNRVLPPDEALISIEIGTLEEVLRQPLSGFNLERWFSNELGAVVAAGGAAAQASEIDTIVLDEEVLGLGALVTTSQYDRYIIVGQLGTSLYKRVQLYTAPGNFADYHPILLQITDSIELAQR
jgi:hypothetical protein